MLLLLLAPPPNPHRRLPPQLLPQPPPVSCLHLWHYPNTITGATRNPLIGFSTDPSVGRPPPLPTATPSTPTATQAPTSFQPCLHPNHRHLSRQPQTPPPQPPPRAPHGGRYPSVTPIPLRWPPPLDIHTTKPSSPGSPSSSKPGSPPSGATPLVDSADSSLRRSPDSTPDHLLSLTDNSTSPQNSLAPPANNHSPPVLHHSSLPDSKLPILPDPLPGRQPSRRHIPSFPLGNAP